MTHPALGDLSLARLRLVTDCDIVWIHAPAGPEEVIIPPPVGIVCPVIRAFVTLWAYAAPSDAHRARAVAHLGLPNAYPGTKAVEAERMSLIGEFGRRRLAMLIDLAGDCEEALAIFHHAERVDRTARRTYGESPVAEMASSLAPPIESPVIPDVAAALASCLKRTRDVTATQASFDRISAESVADAEKTLRELVRV